MSFATRINLGQAGKALKEVLKTYDISQNRQATEMGIGRSNVYRWVHEWRDPTAETVRDIVTAVDEFVRLYNDAAENEEKYS